MGFTHIGDFFGRGMSDDFREEFRRGNPELPRVTRPYYVLKYFCSVWMRFETQLCPVNYADINEPQTPWRNVHGPKQMIVSTADLLQKWINCVEGLTEFLLHWNE